MMTLFALDATNGYLLLDGEVIPGALQDVEVSGGMEVQEAENSGGQGASKMVRRFTDQQVRVSLLLHDDWEAPGGQSIPDSYAALKLLHTRFRSTDQAGNPIIYRLVHEHTASRACEEVLFERLVSVENNEGISVTLEFTEWRPVVLNAANVPGSKAEQEKGAEDSDAPPDTRVPTFADGLRDGVNALRQAAADSTPAPGQNPGQ